MIRLCEQWWKYLYTHLVHALYEMCVRFACPYCARALQNSNRKLQRDLTTLLLDFERSEPGI